MAFGTCVETLDENAVGIESNNVSVGNVAICHWLFMKFASTNNLLTGASTSASHFGETKYLTYGQWGVEGNKLIGNDLKTVSGGQSITSAAWGMELTPPVSLVFYEGNYTFEWF